MKRNFLRDTKVGATSSARDARVQVRRTRFRGGWKFGVIGKLLSGKEVQSSRPGEKPGKALLTPLIPTQPPSRPPSKSFHPLRWSVATDASSRVLLQKTFLNDAKRIPKVALPIYPPAVRVRTSLEKSDFHNPPPTLAPSFNHRYRQRRKSRAKRLHFLPGF